MRIGARGDFLLVRFDARHRGIVATLRETNAALWKEDVVEVFLALEEPPLRYFELEVNPLGGRFSARVESPKGRREGMRVETFSCPEFSADARVRETAWSALLRIPIGELRGGSMPGAFRANCFRIDRTAAEFSALAPTGEDPADFHVVAAFARFRIAPGTGLE